MTYTPNFNDPRVRARSISALTFVEQYIKSTQSRWLSSREIAKHFGWQGRPLGKFLKDHLLICTDAYYNIQTGQCKKYTSNPQGVNNLKQQLGLVAVPVNIPVNLQEQLNTGEFDYKDTGHREYHPLQNLPKRIKLPLLRASNYRHEYDIQCCAQSLLLQHAKRLGFDQATPALTEYISNRTDVRQQLSDQLGLDTHSIKRILTAILNGGSISAWHENMIFAYVDYNRLMISELKLNQYILQYQKDVRAMWKAIRLHQSLSKGERFNAKMKSEMYRFLEEKVRVVIKKHLKKTKNKAFIEHDGWSSERAVDIDRLKYEVEKQTGFVIELDWTIHEYVDSY